MSLTSLILVLLLHHSFAAEFDNTKPVELKGIVTRFDWTNPHAWIYIDVKDTSGKVTHWACMLTRAGWSRDSLKRGDVIVVNGFRAKDGSNLANARTVRLKDGKPIFSTTKLGS